MEQRQTRPRGLLHKSVLWADFILFLKSPEEIAFPEGFCPEWMIDRTIGLTLREGVNGRSLLLIRKPLAVQ